MKKTTLLLTLLLMTVSASAHAAVVYTYTGNNFDRFNYDSSPYDIYPGNFFTTADFVSVQLTLSAALPALSNLRFDMTLVPTFNYQTGPSPVTPLSWQIAAGPLNFTSASNLAVDLTTDVQGNIYSWNIAVSQTLPSFPYGDGTLFSGVDSVILTHSRMQGYSEDYAISCLGDPVCLAAFGYPIGSVGAWDSHPSGTWSVTSTPAPVPIPGAAWLLGSALVFLTSFMRRRAKPI